jgi:hypothetical protein
LWVQAPPRLPFNPSEQIRQIPRAPDKVHWPSGAVEDYRALRANQLVTIREGAGLLKDGPFSLKP